MLRNMWFSLGCGFVGGVLGAITVWLVYNWRMHWWATTLRDAMNNM
jgi:hypothetical protein